MNSRWKRIEITKRVKGKIKLLDLQAQATEKIVGPSCKFWITPEQDLHTHGWRREPGLLEEPVLSESYLCVCPGALDCLVDERSGRGPKR